MLILERRTEREPCLTWERKRKIIRIIHPPWELNPSSFIDFSCFFRIQVHFWCEYHVFDWKIVYRGFLDTKTCESIWTLSPKSFLHPRQTRFDKQCKSTCKKSIKIQWESVEIQSEAQTTSSHMPPNAPASPPCGKRWWVLHCGFLKISWGLGWISCKWIYKALSEDKSLCAG